MAPKLAVVIVALGRSKYTKTTSTLTVNPACRSRTFEAAQLWYGAILSIIVQLGMASPAPRRWSMIALRSQAHPGARRMAEAHGILMIREIHSGPPPHPVEEFSQ